MWFSAGDNQQYLASYAIYYILRVTEPPKDDVNKGRREVHERTGTRGTPILTMGGEKKKKEKKTGRRRERTMPLFTGGRMQMKIGPLFCTMIRSNPYSAQGVCCRAQGATGVMLLSKFLRVSVSAMLTYTKISIDKQCHA